MTRLTHQEIVLLFISLAVLLGAARLLGELARHVHQPAILGELIAGILLGPTVFGRFAPTWAQSIFPTQGALAVAQEGLRTVAIVLYMLVAGMEVNLSLIQRQGKSASVVSMMGILLPLVTGFAAAWMFPQILGRTPGTDPVIFAAFIATAMSISALPVIARTLIDLNLYRSDVGMIVIAAAVFDDLVGWLLFAVILGAAGRSSGEAHGLLSTIALTLIFVLLMLTIGRWLIHRILPWVHAHASWPGGFLGFAFTIALIGAACTTWIGIHPIFGAFLTGIALGDSSHVREQTKKVMTQFISFFFAPLFFASIGSKVDFLQHFDAKIVIAVCLIAVLGKVLGCGLGAMWTGVPRREAWSIGVCLNARGAMEIIVGVLALQSGLIGEKLFVALVLMALITSLITGPIVSRLLKTWRQRRLADFISTRTFLPSMHVPDRFEAIDQLCRAIGATGKIDSDAAREAVVDRERMMATGMGQGVAVPHARIEGLAEPIVAVGLAPGGVDFGAPDGEVAKIICLILTPLPDDGAQLALLADVARVFGAEFTRSEALRAGSYTDFLAVLNTFA